MTLKRIAMPVVDFVKGIFSLIFIIFKSLYWFAEALYKTVIPPPMKSIDGESILVTGAVGGIGKEICKRIVSSGSNIKLVMWDLNEGQLEKFAEELRILGEGKGLQVYPFAVDISSRENIDDCCQKVKESVGPVSIIFNNAGIFPTGNVLQLKNADIESTIRVNFLSHFWIVRQFLPGMIAQNHGRIVQICSVGGLKPAQNSVPYYSSKFGVNGYTEALKMDLHMMKADGIRVTTVYPYVVRTALIGSYELKKNVGFLSRCFFSFQEPEAVARRSVEGMRREFEYIYVPSFCRLFLLEPMFPVKLVRATRKAYFNLHEYKDPEEEKRMLPPAPLAEIIIDDGTFKD